ncbi:MAG: hypothetical protein RLY20_1597 [Verrucomicrobiota bacterium]|jgi:hypothetical protein
MPEPATKSAPPLAERPLQVFASCRMRDIEVLEIVARKLPETVPLKQFIVCAPDSECATMQRRLGSRANVLAEDSMIPGVTIARVRALPMERFPGAAGWYFQQLLKLQFAFADPADDYYLIWDGDTVPLRPMRFFDEQGRMLLTKATEHHAPYFETYRTILGEEANFEFSFIAQHMVVQKSVVRELLGRVEARLPGEGNWAWKLMTALPHQGLNLFSEYETCGHFVKNHYPERVRFIERSWRRGRMDHLGQSVPTEAELAEAAKQFDYAAYERASRGWRRWARWAYRTLKGGA